MKIVITKLIQIILLWHSGSSVEPYVKQLGLKTNKYGNIEVNEKYQTSNPKIYAGGDLAGTKSTVAWASYSGREAAKNIAEQLNKG